MSSLLTTRGLGTGNGAILVTAGLGIRTAIVVVEPSGGGSPLSGRHVYHRFTPQSLVEEEELRVRVAELTAAQRGAIEELELFEGGKPVRVEEIPQEVVESVEEEVRRIFKTEVPVEILKAVQVEHAVKRRAAKTLVRGRIEKMVRARRAQQEDLAEALLVILISI